MSKGRCPEVVNQLGIEPCDAGDPAQIKGHQGPFKDHSDRQQQQQKHHHHHTQQQQPKLQQQQQQKNQENQEKQQHILKLKQKQH